MCFDWYIKVYRCVFHCEIVVRQIVADELERIKSDPALAHLLQQT